MVAQTTGVLLGLLSLKGGVMEQGAIHLLISGFIILLGLWGIISSIVSEDKLRTHRLRINEQKLKIEEILGLVHTPVESKKHTIMIYISFHSLIMALGIILFNWK
jgi:hypothetical protein